MEQHWDAVAAAITARMEELGVTQRDVSQRADVGLSTVQELRNNTRPRRRSAKILAAISEALDWPAGRIEAISRDPAAANSEEATPSAGHPWAKWSKSDSETSAIPLITYLANRLEKVEGRLDALERRVDKPQ